MLSDAARRRVNAAVAVNVCGWKWHRCHEPNNEGETVYHFLPVHQMPPDWWESPSAIEGQPPPAQRGKVLHCVFGLPDYAGTWAGLGEVVEAMGRKGIHFEIGSPWRWNGKELAKVYARFGSVITEPTGGDTAPEAVALAALRAVGVDVDELTKE